MALKRLADAVEREADPLTTFQAPTTLSGGIGREQGVPWSPRDDAMLLLGVYKHGYRAYLEIRDDPELLFSCRSAGPPLPPPLQPTPHHSDDGGGGGAGGSGSASGAGGGAGAGAGVGAGAGGYGLVGPTSAEAAAEWAAAVTRRYHPSDDTLPLAAEWSKGKGAAAPRSSEVVAFESGLEERGECFPSEKEFKARMNALLDALGENERQRGQRVSLEFEWEEVR